MPLIIHKTVRCNYKQLVKIIRFTIMRDKSSHLFIYYSCLVFISLIISCQKASFDDVSTNNDNNVTNELLKSFIDENGGQSSFSSNQLSALETLLLTQDDIEAGRLEQAQEKIENIFTQIPFSDSNWVNISSNSHCSGCSFNFGSPTAYYGLRMLEQIVALGNPYSSESLTMTAVIAPCAEVNRPTLPNYTPETVNLNIAPEITENNGRLLQVSTALFRKWVQAITGGVKVNLRVHILNQCTTVNYTDNGNTIVSYPDAQSMIDAVPNDIAEDTDFWWVIAPSGVPGDGSGYNRHFITGGMSSYGAGLPLFLSDDAWFIRKPEHMGVGTYHEVEIRAYQPQWFQHEFMHHLYRKWYEFGLEDTSHQWFDRSTWPSDFIGKWEPDYYIESINKRLLNASPSLAEGLRASDQVDFEITDTSIIVGEYERQPVQNQWHEVEIVLINNLLHWQNNAGANWTLSIIDGELWTGADCPYGEKKLPVLLDSNQEIKSIYFNGEPYVKIN